MDFKYKPNGGGGGYNYSPPAPATAPPQSSSSLGYFAEQALRGGFMHPDLPRPGDYFSNSRSFPDTVLREIEKQKIREEIIAAEVERRRQLEVEVRREMMIEREMALQSGHPHNYSLSGAQEMLMNSRLPMLNCPESRFADSSPFSRKSEIRITEMKDTPEVNKERIVVLPKPEVSISGIKRKQVTPPGATNLMISSSNPNKKLKEALSCEICHVRATSEQALKEHFQGKKHKSKEARLPSHIAGENFAIGLFSRKAPTKDESVAIQEKQNEEVSNEQEMQNEEVSNELVKEEKGDVVLQKSEESVDVKNDEAGKKKKDNLKFSFWCEMCKIGAFSKKVMSAHMKGKKHTARVLDGLGIKKENVEEMAVKKEINEAKQDIDVGTKETKEIEKYSAEDDEKKDVNEVAVTSESDRVVAALRIGWIG